MGPQHSTDNDEDLVQLGMVPRAVKKRIKRRAVDLGRTISQLASEVLEAGLDELPQFQPPSAIESR